MYLWLCSGFASNPQNKFKASKWSDFPIPSKTYVNKCGDIIRKGNNWTSEYQNAFKVISDWRNLHSQPLNEVRALIKIRLNRLGFKKLIIGQRFKTCPSIIKNCIDYGGIDC